MSDICFRAKIMTIALQIICLILCWCFFIDILVFNISVVKESQICYYYWFSGPKKLWLKNLRTVKKCRLAIFSHNIEVVELLNAWSFNNRVLTVIFDCCHQCTVLEVKVIEGHGTTIDVVLVNGVLHEGDQIVVSGMQASIQNLTTFINTCFLHLTNKVYNIGSNCYHNSSFIDTSSNEGTSC
jgi:hypothetical protein